MTTANKIDENDLEDVVESYKRCVSTGFFDDFYTNFLKQPEISAYFVNTDFEKQKKLLRMGLAHMISFAGDKISAKMALERIAVIHDKEHHNVLPKYYSLWIDSLLFTISRHDTEYELNLHEKWIRVLNLGVEFFKSRY